MNIKSLPLNELTVSAVLYVYNNGTDAQDCPDIQVEVAVKDAASYARYTTWIDQQKAELKAHRCSCCGHSIRWASIVEHLPTKTFHAVGKDCAQGIVSLSRVSAAFAGASVALAQRAEANRREATFRRSAGPEAGAALDWAKTGVNRTAKDIADKIRKYDTVSDKQVAFLVGLHQRDVAYRNTLTGGLVAGKQTLAGTVQSVKVQYSDYVSQANGKNGIIKALVQLTNGCKVWGTAPEGTVAGTNVTFSAIVELSDKDPAFGFYKRPTKWTVQA